MHITEYAYYCLENFNSKQDFILKHSSGSWLDRKQLIINRNGDILPSTIQGYHFPVLRVYFLQLSVPVFIWQGNMTWITELFFSIHTCSLHDWCVVWDTQPNIITHEIKLTVIGNSELDVKVLIKSKNLYLPHTLPSLNGMTITLHHSKVYTSVIVLQHVQVPIFCNKSNIMQCIVG